MFRKPMGACLACSSPVSNGKDTARHDESDGREQRDTPGAVATLPRGRCDAGEGAQRHRNIVAVRRDEGLALGKTGGGHGGRQRKKKSEADIKQIFSLICGFDFRVAMKRQTQLINLAQLLLAPLPAYLLSRHLLSGEKISTPGFFGLLKSTSISSPFAFANILLSFSFLLGWLASLLQGSTWLIDPYWTLVPPLLDAFYKKACSGSSSRSDGRSFLLFPSSSSSFPPRAAAATLLLLLWSLRLTHSYFRRERWRLGAEDWRYQRMRREWGGHWWWWQLVPVYLVQHLLLVGLALPSFALRCCSSAGSGSRSAVGGCLSSCASSSSYSSSFCSSSSSSSSASGRLGGFLLSLRGGGTESSAAPPPSWHPLSDSLAVAAALSGLALALLADSQLHAFVSRNERGRSRGARATVLDSGLWSLSRHPNYLGETVFHLSLAALAVSGRYASSAAAAAAAPGGSPPRLLSLSVLWPLAGAALNTACLLAVTRMTEARTAAAKGRKGAWEGYCSRVPCWIPRVGPLVRALTSSGPAAKPRARRKR